MNKLKILEMGNEGSYSFLVLQKHEEFCAFLSAFIEEAFHKPPCIHIGKGHDDIFKSVDLHESMIIDDVRIDVFYGKKKIILIFISNQDRREKLNKVLFQYVEFKMCGFNKEATHSNTG